jgi:Leucine-rich repeat (LRR) protein
LERLRWLDLSNNYLKSLPAGLDSLRQLAKLNLSFNQLTQLPIALGNIHTLKGIWYNTAPIFFCGGTGTPNLGT